MKPILVLGATGTVGSEVLTKLVAKGATVRAAVHSPAKARNLQSAWVETVHFDYASPQTMRKAMQGVEHMFLLTPFVRDMVAITEDVVRMAQETGVRHIVKLSGLGAGYPGGITLARWHTEAEQAVERSGLAWTHLRPNSFMQNYVTYHATNIRSQNAFYLPHGDGRISLVDARDIGAVAAEILTGKGHEGRVYHLTGPEAISNTEIARILSDVTGRRIDYVDVPEDVARAGLRAMGAPDWMIHALMELNRLNRDNHTATVYPDVEHILRRDALSFRDFAESFRQTFARAA